MMRPMPLVPPVTRTTLPVWSSGLSASGLSTIPPGAYFPTGT
jgi:hypothetical protein